MEFAATIRAVRDEHHRLVDGFLDRHGPDLDTLASWIATSLLQGGKVLFFGNGGSAADAQHLAAEFVNRYDRDRPALAALALATDGSALTSIGNDAAFRAVFTRQIEALGRAGDVAVGITTSGRSPNVLDGLAAARRLGLRTAALLGRDGGPAREIAELSLVVPGEHTGRIQEVHILAGHLICQRVEEILTSSWASADP
jgi:D-sedoheptulose 7-phosphate isomerase